MMEAYDERHKQSGKRKVHIVHYFLRVNYKKIKIKKENTPLIQLE